MWRLLIINGVQEGRALRLKAGVNRIGRSSDNHFQIPDPSVSSAHCEVVFSDAGFLVRDLNSTNGTFIDGEPVSREEMEPGQMLQVGKVELRLEEVPTAEEATPIVVPELTMPALVGSVMLANGALACANHPEVPGDYRCSHCLQALCESCVRIIKRISGDVMVFCSLCNAQCEPLLPPEHQKTTEEKEGFFGRLAKTLRLSLRR